MTPDVSGKLIDSTQRKICSLSVLKFLLKLSLCHAIIINKVSAIFLFLS